MKLPQITYSRPVEAMGRYDDTETAIIRKTGEVEAAGIRASTGNMADAILRAGKINAGAITEAGMTVAAGGLAAAKASSEIRYKRAILDAKLDYSDRMLQTQMVSILGGLAQTGMKAYFNWQADQNTAKVAHGLAVYEGKIGTLDAQLNNRDRIDLNGAMAQDLNLVYNESDVTTVTNDDGSTSRWVPTHRVSQQMLDQRRAQWTEQAAAGVSDEYRMQLESGLATIDGKAAISRIKNDAVAKKKDLTATFSAAAEQHVLNGNPLELKKVLAQGQAAGVWSAADAATIQRTGAHRMMATRFQNDLDAAPNEAAAKDIKTRITNSSLPDERKNRLRSEAQTTINRLTVAAKNATNEQKAGRDNLRVTDLVNEAMARGGTFQEQQSFMTEALRKEGRGELLPNARALWTNRRNSIESIAAAGSAKKHSEYRTQLEKDPTFQRPPPATGDANETGSWKLFRAREQGRDVTTNLKEYYRLHDLAMSPDPGDQRAFAAADLTLSRHQLDAQSYGYLTGLQQDLSGGDPVKLTQVQTTNAQIDRLGDQVFGHQWRTNTKKAESMRGLQQAVQVHMQQYEKAHNRKMTPVEQQDLVTKLGGAMVDRHTRWNTTKGIMDTPTYRYMPAIREYYRGRRMPLPSDPQKLLDTYQMLKNTGVIE